MCQVFTVYSAVGALLAGSSQESIAQQFIDRFIALEGSQGSEAANCAAANLPSFQGVVFYSNGWQIMDRAGYIQQKAVSPLKEHEAFVIFDEARCRYATYPRFLFLHGGKNIATEKSPEVPFLILQKCPK
jgi:hypothetical protein